MKSNFVVSNFGKKVEINEQSMKAIMIALFLATATNMWAQTQKPQVRVEKISIEYKGKSVSAKRLTVSSTIQMPIERVWSNVSSPQLLEFVAKGMIRFKPENGEFPQNWSVGPTYKTKMRVFGWIPFGGVHHLIVEKKDSSAYEIATKEWDRGAKVWNHSIVLKDLGNEHTHYEDSIVIYAGIKTGFITAFAKRFYKHRQKRWHIVAENNLRFGESS